ncbi:uncharacterized protein N7459_002550 [Penicillium hispanicum]|uniref:uncharacterized protein n=1 Tax=Penicillium hispanicum TaxID=1080232 RepID=UPI00254039DF|nr:uncharacterized protein N7459_002550 [Penicillium hispanicum]KAJ5586785.1 hypothetical protein N7459_002550 [Penicillium hispanicum]
MFDAIKNWFQPTQEAAAENKWDANTLAMQQPGSPAAPEMNQTVSQQPGAPESMGVHLRGGGEGEDVCCGV